MSVLNMFMSPAITAVLFMVSLVVPGQCLAQSQKAVWKRQEATLVYLGTTTHYSCAGLALVTRRMVLALGARPDLSVEDFGCNGPRDSPSMTPAVKIKWWSLQAVDTAGTVEAVWQTVDIVRAGQLEGRDCELARQVVRQIIPLFASRNIKQSLTCVPHQAPPQISLQIDVLVPRQGS